MGTCGADAWGDTRFVALAGVGERQRLLQVSYLTLPTYLTYGMQFLLSIHFNGSQCLLYVKPPLTSTAVNSRGTRANESRRRRRGFSDLRCVSEILQKLLLFPGVLVFAC
jgi:hypothetical protein